MLKKLALTLLLIAISMISFAQESEVVRLSEPVQETQTHEVFGAEISEWEEGMDIVSLIESADKFSGKTITIETKVSEVCQKKGCFIVATQDGYSARITFKDYSFFIPTDATGKTVKLQGTFEVKTLTEEEAKHYAEDAGNNPDNIEGEQKEYAIVATSVSVPKS